MTKELVKLVFFINFLESSLNSITICIYVGKKYIKIVKLIFNI